MRAAPTRTKYFTDFCASPIQERQLLALDTFSRRYSLPNNGPHLRVNPIASFVEAVDRIVDFAQHLSLGGVGPRVVLRPRVRGTLTE